MRRLPAVSRLAVSVALAALAVILPACSEQPQEPPAGARLATGRTAPPGFEAALRAQSRHGERLLATPGVVGTGVGLARGGHAVVKVYTERSGVAGVPRSLDQVPVEVAVTGRIIARADPTTRVRPAPIGFSVGHPSITAGTIGARVIDASGNVYLLSNNHVLAASNSALLNDPALQPGPVDGGTNPADRIGTLSAFEPLNLGWDCYGCVLPSNTIDAAIALSNTADLGNGTQAGGYGVPSPLLFGDGNGDGVLDNRGLLLGIGALKYGRTTLQTEGQVTEVNVTIKVCYDIFCFSAGRFLDQIGICCAGFSDGGDSGSLIVSNDGSHKPFGLLFAGGGDRTFANRIDLVLNRFGVKIDGSTSPPPPTPITDLAVSSVSAPASATVGDQVSVTVTVLNTGNQAVTGDIGVTLVDATDNVPIGTPQTLSGLGVGGSANLTFGWTTTGRSPGAHTLTATHSRTDDVASNNSGSTVITLNQPAAGGMHVGDLDGSVTGTSRVWTATVTIVVHDGAHAPLSGATVRGAFSNGGKGTGSCITGSNGSCTISKSRLRGSSVTFAVTSLTHASNTYVAGGNHDAETDSNGTTIVVASP
jgi:hypothetical protein